MYSFMPRLFSSLSSQILLSKSNSHTLLSFFYSILFLTDSTFLFLMLFPNIVRYYFFFHRSLWIGSSSLHVLKFSSAFATTFSFLILFTRTPFHIFSCLSRNHIPYSSFSFVELEFSFNYVISLLPSFLHTVFSH